MRIAALIVVVLTGCVAPGGELADTRGGWDGATYDEVVLRWGTPARSTKLTDGRDVYTWVSDSVGSRGSSSVYTTATKRYCARPPSKKCRSCFIWPRYVRWSSGWPTAW